MSCSKAETCSSKKPLDQAELISMIELQLSEVDMLQSMFPDPKELILDDLTVPIDLRDFAEGRVKFLPSRLGFVLNLDVEKGHLNMSINLPHEYPAVPPDIFVRSQTLNREAQRQLNEELMEFLTGFQYGDLSVGPAVTWLQDNGEKFFSNSEATVETEVVQKQAGTKDSKFVRLWVYSHHIYSKVKRKDILDLAEELDLTGFCLPGKPGIICIEGLAYNTEEWWQRVRSWNWQKILIKNREVTKLEANEELSTHRRFTGFEELGSESDIRVKSGGFHVDMGDVYRYLEKHDSGYIFKDYFGVDGKPA
ncbi:RWD domain-containing protein 2A-like [Macrobrachium nipponense]|uniref:RWD domain-containing protein 2A-like n=1 Tax=Macrobrachium nipponense TaxID=159736 RepID=UPI0030C807CE